VEEKRTDEMEMAAKTNETRETKEKAPENGCDLDF